jgi:predicted porin
MKKSIMMAAVAALLAGPAMSDVSIYGQVEQSVNTGSTKALSDDNYVGVSVNEALNETSSAFAKIEFGVDDGTNTVTNRETYVGITMDGITGQAGRMKNLKKTMVNGVDAFQGSSFSVGGAARADDTLMVKGEIAGVTVAASTILDGTANADEVGETRELGASVEVQGISLSVVQTKAGSADATMIFGAGVDVAGVNLAVSHEPDATNKTTTVVGSADFGANTVRVGNSFVDGSNNTMIAEVAHNFSKNTSVFVNHSKTENATGSTQVGFAMKF